MELKIRWKWQKLLEYIYLKKGLLWTIKPLYKSCLHLEAFLKKKDIRLIWLKLDYKSDFIRNQTFYISSILCTHREHKKYHHYQKIGEKNPHFFNSTKRTSRGAWHWRSNVLHFSLWGFFFCPVKEVSLTSQTKKSPYPHNLHKPRLKKHLPHSQAPLLMIGWATSRAISKANRTCFQNMQTDVFSNAVG